MQTPPYRTGISPRTQILVRTGPDQEKTHPLVRFWFRFVIVLIIKMEKITHTKKYQEIKSTSRVVHREQKTAHFHRLSPNSYMLFLQSSGRLQEWFGHSKQQRRFQCRSCGVRHWLLHNRHGSLDPRIRLCCLLQCSGKTIVLPVY